MTQLSLTPGAQLAAPAVSIYQITARATPPEAGPVQRAARLALWTLPAYAATVGWLPLAAAPDPAADPGEWAARVTSGGHAAAYLIAGVGGLLFGVVALVALAVLLAAGRARWIAGAALLTGLLGTALLLVHQGVAMRAGPLLGEAVLAGDLAAAATYQRAYGGALPVVAAVLLTLAWSLVGLAVWRSGELGRAEGVLMMLGAPLIGVGSLFAAPVAPLGALVLIAAGFSVAWRRPAPARR